MQCIQMINSQLWNVHISGAYTCRKRYVYHHDSLLGAFRAHSTSVCRFDCMQTMCAYGSLRWDYSLPCSTCRTSLRRVFDCCVHPWTLVLVAEDVVDRAEV